MKKILFSVLFFLVFYRVSLIYSWAYASLLLSVTYIVISLALSKVNVVCFVDKGGVFSLMYLFFCYFLVFDLFFGGDFDNMSMSLRIFSIFLISVVPAYIICMEYTKGSIEKVADLLNWALWLQLFFWIITYVDIDRKIFFYHMMGVGDSVNLWEQNLRVRGFGLSNEINFTSPAVSVFLSFILFSRRKFITFLNIVTQIVNSNLVSISLLFGFFVYKISFFKKTLLFIFSVVFIFLYGLKYIPRLSDELEGGGGRTIKILMDNHFNFYNDGVREWIFGAGVKVYGNEIGSDVGWVILINYYGFISIFFSLILLWIISRKAFPVIKYSIIWFLFGVILNTKGLVIGANAYIFISFLMMFNNEFRKDTYRV